MAATLESDTFRPAVCRAFPEPCSHNVEIIAHFDAGQLRGRKMQIIGLGKQGVSQRWPRGANVGTA
jgi:hypothetical protein